MPRAAKAFASVALALALAPAPRRAAAVDPFEIQVYDGTADAPGEAGLEVHANHVAVGASALPPGARDLEREGHLTFEPSYGVLPTWEVGAYLQTALDAEGRYRYAGAKVRSKLVTRPGWRPRLRLGLNAELSWLPAAFEPDRFGGELRPIVAWENDDWLLAGNPILDFTLTGSGLRAGPAFEPAVAVKRKLGVSASTVAVGIEYYAGFGPVTDLAPWSEQEQTIFETVDVAWRWRDAGLSIDLNLGLGQGLTPATERLVGKSILGVAFDSQRR